jgi:hypothetical protein
MLGLKPNDKVVLELDGDTISVKKAAKGRRKKE